MLLKGFYYLYFVLSRLCRASKDKAWGDFRVHILLMIVEVNFVFGLLYSVLREQFGELNRHLYVIGMVLPLLAMNLYLFANDQKRRSYEREFLKYPRNKRRAADVITVLACLGALLFPLMVLPASGN